jgi:hypothetical protein
MMRDELSYKTQETDKIVRRIKMCCYKRFFKKNNTEGTR